MRDAHSFSRKPGADRKDAVSSYPQGVEQSSRQNPVLREDESQVSCLK